MLLARGEPSERPAILYSYRETRGSRDITDILSTIEESLHI
jgi:hypothetical protein